MYNEILQGDALEVLRTLPSEHVQTVVTSPPYFGLRDYGMQGQIGMEETPAAYVQRLVEVFREVKRVLRNDGTVWLNLGDSYVAPKTGNVGVSSALEGGKATQRAASLRGDKKPVNGTKPKDLMMIPARVAIALCDDGWYLRSDIVWHKTNAMPESVKDRPTKAHEYVFLLSKQERYFYDADSIREPLTSWVQDDQGQWKCLDGGGQSGTKQKIADRYPGMQGKVLSGNMSPGKRIVPNPAGRNKRSVWSVPTSPFPGAHFAVMAPELAETCILAGSAMGDIVLDPFSGAGTTAYVANRLNRRWLGIELNPQYVEMSRKRLSQLALDWSA